MKRAILPLLTVIVMVAFCGCAAERAHRAAACPGGCAPADRQCQCEGQSNCDPGDRCAQPARKLCRCPFCGGWRCADGQCCEEQPAAAPGPATGAVTYPYYTVRGPRDFLAKNPSSIGP